MSVLSCRVYQIALPEEIAFQYAMVLHELIKNTPLGLRNEHYNKVKCLKKIIVRDKGTVACWQRHIKKM